MEGYVKIDGGRLEARVMVDLKEIARFIKSADILYRAAKASIVASLIWLALRWWLGW
jgi:hypothetical protein